MDTWGRIYRDHWERNPHSHACLRDDGHRQVFESATHYFTAPRLEAERRVFRGLGGPVLDLACGPGSYALYLQNHGLTVTAVDSSPRAVRIAQARGCADARVMDLRELAFEAEAFETVLVMGNTFGLHMTPTSLRDHMTELRRITRDGGVLVTSTVDPLDTEDPAHLRYHERNRARGRPPGLVRIRMSYREEESEWFELWLTTRDEVEPIAFGAGWELEDELAEGAHRVRVFRAMNPGG